MNEGSIRTTDFKVNSGSRTCRVITDYQATYADPITMRASETVEFEGKEDNWNGWIWLWCTNSKGKSGWVPKSYLEQTDTLWRACVDYDAVELSVHTGEELTVEKQESGWLWCTNSRGKSGWVPIENVGS